MKVNKQFFEQLMQGSIAERDKARQTFERQQAIVNLCELILKDGEFEETPVTENNEVTHGA